MIRERMKNSLKIPTEFITIIIIKNTLKKYSKLIHESIKIEFIFKHYLFKYEFFTNTFIYFCY